MKQSQKKKLIIKNKSHGHNNPKKLNFLIFLIGALLFIMLGVLIYGVSGLHQVDTSSYSTSVLPTAASSGGPSVSSGQSPQIAAKEEKTSSNSEYVLPAASSQSTFSSSSCLKSSSSSELFSQSSGPTEISSAAKDDSGSKISKGEYDSLKEGVSLDDAVDVIGGDGTLENEMGDTKIYRWDGWGSQRAWAKLTFRNGKLTKKYQFGL